MTIFENPEDAEHPDERLRILWIDDRHDMVPTLLGPVARQVVQIVGVNTPSEVWQILNEIGQEDILRNGFDAYVTDFQLTAQTQGPSAQSQNESPRDRS